MSELTTNKKSVLAFDFGASSGRAMLASYEDGKINLREIHRFSNDPVNVCGTLYWDILRLFHEMKQGILKAKQLGGFDSIGIDTWGVDFGLIDSDGKLLENPVHYRDSRTDGMVEEVFKTVDRDELYKSTGNQIMAINTLFQLYSLKKNRPEILNRADKLLFIPDLLAYFLTGEKHSEYTIATTAQLLSAQTGDWNRELMKKLGLPDDIFCDIIQPGSVHGMLKADICEELGVDSVPVIAIAQHDTASAVAAVPAKNDDFIYVSCGTWSLFGTLLKKPLVNDECVKANITNEGGISSTIRFLKNIMGLWLIQESRRQWIREGNEMSYAELERLALDSKPFSCFIDPDAPDFVKPGNLPKRIRAFCERTGQHVPATTGEVMRCIYESIAFKYRYSLEQIEAITGKKYPAIHIVGGGTKDNLLCRMTASACNTDVFAGPIEATVCGNVAVQLCALGEIESFDSIRSVVENSSDIIKYAPTNPADWDSEYERFKSIIIKTL